ncbi:MAG: plastocyanin/azurin family copper-binding protein [Chthoniobacteraceae bacterium]
MKTIPLHLLAITALIAAAACSKAPEQTESSTADQTPATSQTAPQPTADASIPEKKVEITGNDQMKFDTALIEVKPSQKVSLTLKNVGTMPKVSMGHNWVLLAKDQDPAAFVEASQMQMANEYVAPELKSKVLAHTKLLGPGESDTITFVAPSTPGDYTYICSFPGHFAIGMKGILKVQ